MCCAAACFLHLFRYVGKVSIRVCCFLVYLVLSVVFSSVMTSTGEQSVVNLLFFIELRHVYLVGDVVFIEVRQVRHVFVV